MSSPSYDLGRAYGQRRLDEKLAGERALAELAAEQERRHQSVRAMLAARPDVLADYDARMAEIRASHP
jgi:hypothetical protein